jgi:pimeloyl-ACP methyl ester carboxylesterase
MRSLAAHISCGKNAVSLMGLPVMIGIAPSTSCSIIQIGSRMTQPHRPIVQTPEMGSLSENPRVALSDAQIGYVVAHIALNVSTKPKTEIAMTQTIKYETIAVDGLNIAYREGGDPTSPKLVLLHGFPASSHQYRNLLPALADRFHVIAPDYPGFGNSDVPDPAKFPYTFDKLSEVVEAFLKAKGFDHYGLYVQDYGGPVGFRIVGRHPEALDWLIIQNSNAYEVGFTQAWDGFRKALWVNRSSETEKPLAGFLTRDAIKSVYLHGARRPELISPDNWEMDWAFMQRPNEIRINLDLFYDYRTNVPLYPTWQALLRQRQPKTIIFWGQDDIFFTKEGGDAYLKDLPKAEMHRLDAGHFAVEDNLDFISANIHRFYTEKVAN